MRKGKITRAVKIIAIKVIGKAYAKGAVEMRWQAASVHKDVSRHVDHKDETWKTKPF